MVSQTLKPLIMIIGPTGVGKTDAAIALALRLGGEIVSADSRLLYRGMDIGTAKPAAEERRAIPHHLIDIAAPDETVSLPEFLEKAYAAIDAILSRGKLPLLVGGTGQYIRAILEGWRIPRQEPDHHFRKVLTQWADDIGAEALHNRLRAIDPDAAEQIDYRNVRRVVRALEVIFKTGSRFSDLREKQTCRYEPIVCGIDDDRDRLYARIDQRIEDMIASGWISEVQSLLDAGYSPRLPSFSAIGYAEIIDHLQGELTLDDAITRIKRNTRSFVRHQANWFKPSDPRIAWFSAGEALVDQMEAYIRRKLNELE